VSDADDRLDPGSGDRRAERAIATVAGVGSAVVVTLFFCTLAQLQPVSDAVVVVVADPAVPAGRPLAVRVLGVGARGRLPFVGAVDGVAVDDNGLAVIPRGPALAVQGMLDDVAVSLIAPLPVTAGPPDDGTSLVPWSRTLALPAQGAAVYPEAGLVTGRGVSRVLLVDDRAARVLDIAAGENARLPDGRLLLVDRAPLLARLRSLAPAPGDDVVVQVSGVDAEQPLALELLVGGVVRAIADARGAGDHALPLPADARPGELVVVRVATSPLPSAAGRTLVTRVGGPRPADLTRVEPRIAHVARDAGVGDDLIARALLARHVPRVRQAPVVSPSLHAQVARRETERDIAVAVWRGRMRLAAAVLFGFVVVAAAHAARRAPALAAGALLVVLGVLGGLDVVLGAAAGSLGG